MNIQIDLVLTQILGFVLFVWILRRLAWGPVVNVLEARRDRIREDFAAAERAKREADELKARFDQELKGIEAKARVRIQEAVAEGQKVAAEIKQQAQAEAQHRLERAGDEILREREKAKELLKQQVAHLSILTAEKILRQKLDDANQRKLVATYIDEVGQIR
jgi:F-type H+-transporting ATPase subunit b